jgi:hypothetical protein
MPVPSFTPTPCIAEEPMSEHQYITVVLPSRGELNGDKIPGGKIEVRKMCAPDEALLVSGSNVDRISKLLIACVRLPNGTPLSELLVTERFFALLAIRTVTFGPKYDYTYTCEKCGAANKDSVDITTDFPEHKAPDGTFEEPVYADLPDKRCRVGLRFMRGFDEDKIAKKSKRLKMQSLDTADDSYIYRIGLSLTSRDGAEFGSPLDKEDFVRSLTSLDIAYIRAAIEKGEPRIETDVYPECAKCHHIHEMDFPMTAEFFRPTIHLP